MSLLPTTYEIFSSILSRVTAYVDEIAGVCGYGFLHNRSTADHICCICQVLEKKWEYNEIFHQLFID
jgi:hypothetical protein